MPSSEGLILGNSSMDRSMRLLNAQQNALMLYRTGRFWGWFGLAWFPALFTTGYRAWLNFALAPVIGGAVFSAGIATILVQALLTQMVVTNRGVFLRQSEPIRFWVFNLVLFLGYCAVMVGILKG